eukprot:SAG11_NODE_2012_length_3924_cov_1.906667_3_plen_126_part_00
MWPVAGARASPGSGTHRWRSTKHRRRKGGVRIIRVASAHHSAVYDVNRGAEAASDRQSILLSPFHDTDFCTRAFLNFSLLIVACRPPVLGLANRARAARRKGPQHGVVCGAPTIAQLSNVLVQRY